MRRLGVDWLVLKKTVGPGRESSRWIMKPDCKQLDFVDRLHDGKQVIAWFSKNIPNQYYFLAWLT